MIDIAGSILVGGLLLLVVIRMDERATMNTYQTQATLTVQENMTSLAEEIEWYFSKIGYINNDSAAPDRRYFILAGTSDSIAFEADLERRGVFDTVSYYLGEHVPDSPNPDVRFFYRKTDERLPVEANLGIAQFNLTYFDQFNDTIPPPITAPNNVRTVQVTVKIEPTVAYDAAYDTVWSVWSETRLISRNLLAR